jgi:poly(glycerol-phosphate) alpha-glucosyltransferase
VKIAYLLNSISRKAGGLFDACRRLAQTSVDEDEITVLGVEDEFTKIDIKQWAPLRPAVCRAFGSQTFGYAPAYMKCLAETAADMTHVHGLWTFASLAGYRWHRRTKHPFMYTAHGMLEPWALRNSRWKKNIVRLLWENAAHRSAACFHATSKAEHISIRSYGLSNPICIIPNGIDLPNESANRAAPWAAEAHGRKVLLYLGRLHPKKNLPALLDAWAAIQKSEVKNKKSREWVLAIAGWDQGRHEEELRSKARSLQIETSVMFLGPMFGDDKAAAYQNALAFILPSLSEGLPMAVLEAWAYAKPVLMTQACNLPEGFAANAAVEVGTRQKEIATALIALMQMSESDQMNMGSRGRALVAKEFSWPRIGEQMHAVYQWVLGGGSPPATVRLD